METSEVQQESSKPDAEPDIFALYPWNDPEEIRLMAAMIERYEASGLNPDYDPALCDVE